MKKYIENSGQKTNILKDVMVFRIFAGQPGLRPIVRHNKVQYFLGGKNTSLHCPIQSQAGVGWDMLNGLEKCLYFVNYYNWNFFKHFFVFGIENQVVIILPPIVFGYNAL